LVLLRLHQQRRCGKTEEIEHIDREHCWSGRGKSKQVRLSTSVLVEFCPFICVTRCASWVLMVLRCRLMSSLGSFLHGTPGRQSDPRIHLPGVLFWWRLRNCCGSPVVLLSGT
jgi:hypothetical protein